MTTALWLLYLADVAEGLRVLCILTAAVSILVFGGWLLFGHIEDFEPKPPKFLLIGGIAAAIVAVALPGRSVLYAAAAYNAGQAALTTDTGNRAVQAINRWIDRQARETQRGD